MLLQNATIAVVTVTAAPDSVDEEAVQMVLDRHKDSEKRKLLGMIKTLSKPFAGEHAAHRLILEKVTARVSQCS